MINFKLVDKVDDMVTGPVLSTALAGGTTEDHRVTFEKALDLGLIKLTIQFLKKQIFSK